MKHHLLKYSPPYLPQLKQATEAARLRAQHQLKTPDAIQLATAIHAGAQTFLTNDKRIRSLPAIKVLVVQDFVTT